MEKTFKNKIFKRRSIVLTWMLTYALLLLIPIIVNILMYFRVDRIVKEEVNKSNDFLLTQIQQYMDGVSNETKKLSTNIAFSYTVQDIVNFQGDSTSDNQYKSYEAVKELKGFRTANPQVSNFYIYLKNYDMILSPDTNISSKQFFEVYSGIDKKLFDKWKNIINGEYQGSYIYLEDENANNNLSSRLFYITSLPVVNRLFGYNGNLLVSIDESKFLNMSDGVESINHGTVMIMDSSNRIIATNGKKSNVLSMKYNDFKGERGISYSTYAGEKVAISYVSSKVEKWKYIHIMPQKIFMEKLDTTRKSMYISVLICLFLGIPMAYLMLRKNYAPISGLIDKLRIISKPDSEGESNEYKFIADTIDITLNERELINHELEAQKDILKVRFLEKLLKGKGTYDGFKDGAKAFDIQFHSDAFMVLAFYIENLSVIFLEMAERNIEESIKVVQFVISNMLQELAEDKFDLFFTEADNTVTAIVNLKNENSGVSETEVVDIINKLQYYIGTFYKTDITVAISNIHFGVISISEAYAETLEAMEYKTIMGIEGVICYNKISDYLNKEYYYSLTKEQKLINSVKVGEFDSARQVIEEVFEANFKQKSISPQIAKCLVYDIVSTLLKIVNELSAVSSGDINKDLSKIEQLAGINNIYNIKEGIIDILDSLCSQVRLNKKDRNIDTKLMVQEYISNNYRDVNLSVSSIADYMNINSSYLSKLYREEYDEGILDFINKVRIEKAKEIMEAEKINVEEIAKLVGYSNTRTFMRAFSKIEGVTPGKYKESL